MSNHTTIRVNFGRPMPLFPLPVQQAVLMPHGIAALDIFEPRYRQMVSDALDAAGLIAMAVLAGEQSRETDHGRPPVRPAVCVGHIAQHFRYPDGRYALVLQGVCRGRIVRELPPGGVTGGNEGKLYREAIIEPVGVEDEQASGEVQSGMEELRTKITAALDEEPLADLKLSSNAIRYLKDPSIPTLDIIEYLGANLPESHADAESRYRWLAAADPGERAKIVTKRLDGLATLLRRAAPQRKVETVKGCSWN